MFDRLKDLLNYNKERIAISKAMLDNYFRKINDNINSVEELSITLNKFSLETDNYKELCLTRTEFLFLSEKNIVWRDVLDFKRNVGYFDDGRKEAVKLGYQYFIWNGLIYSSKLEGMHAIGCVEDLG